MRKDTHLLIRGTPGSIRVCQRIAEKSKGVCLLGFSRGKDSICAWLWLRRFFHTIIPFHCASIPHLSFVDQSLAYYEKEFETKIERCMSGDIYYLMLQLVMQPASDEQRFDAMKKECPGRWSKYGNNEVATVIKQKHNLPPETYTAYGISMWDSLFRRLRMTEKGGGVKEDAGYRDSTFSFFPCFDWRTNDVIRAVELAGLRLPDDYQLANRTIANGLDAKHLVRMKRLYPKDHERVKALFPFIEAGVARTEFRKMHARG
jgi:hypothetical protein